MPGEVIRAEAITPEKFAPFGDVIFGNKDKMAAMNDARFIRFQDLATVDVDDSAGGRASFSIARCRHASSLPHRVDMLERHPLGSQAFVPMAPFSFLIMVAPPGDSVRHEDLRAFVTMGRQGINYHRGVWHMPMIGLVPGQDFLIVDRAGGGANCDELTLDDPVYLDV